MVNGRIEKLHADQAAERTAILPVDSNQFVQRQNDQRGRVESVELFQSLLNWMLTGFVAQNI